MKSDWRTVHNANKKWALALSVVVCIVSALIATLPHYGLTWDEPYEFNLAEHEIEYILTFGEKSLDFDKPLYLSSKEHFWTNTGTAPYTSMDFGYILSTACCLVFYKKLGLFSPVVAHHMINPLLLAMALIVVFALTDRNYGTVAAFAALMAISFQPRFWAHMHFNMKDTIYAFLMTFTLLTARSAFLKFSWRGSLCAASLFGLSLATKPNALAIIAILVMWLPFAWPDRREKNKRERIIFFSVLLLTPLVTLLSFVAVKPWMWPAPWESMKNIIDFYSHRGASGPDRFQWDRLLLFVAVQPPAILLFSTVGVFAAVRDAFRGVRRELTILLLLWAFLPVIRVLLPKMYDFDGVRHFIEYSIPLGILSGIGFSALLRMLMGLLAKRMKRMAAAVLSIVILGLPISAWAYSLIVYHPHEIAYFNFIVGGTKGAQKIWLDATDYWGSSYLQAARWLNENAEPRSAVTVPIASHLFFSQRNTLLRSDITLYASPNEVLNFDELRELMTQNSTPQGQFIYFVITTRRDWRSDLVKPVVSAGNPVHSVETDGAPLVNIYKVKLK